MSAGIGGIAGINEVMQPHPEAASRAIVIENRHTGERLALERFVEPGADVVCLRLRGALPAGRQGPPLHVHHAQDEEGVVLSGTLSAEVDGDVRRFRASEHVVLPLGTAHRWWNDGDGPLTFEGIARPAVDLDLFLQAAFEVINAGPDGRPSLFYLAHVAWRHRRTQAVRIVPAPVAAVLLPLVVLIGTLLGRYRGRDWPGAPGRHAEAPYA